MSQNQVSINSKFRPKKSSPRKVTTQKDLKMNSFDRAKEFGLSYYNLDIKLGEMDFAFDLESATWNGNIYLFSKKEFNFNFIHLQR